MLSAPIAQRIEHRSSEPSVVGSNPSRRIFSHIFTLTAGFNRGELGDTDNQGTSDGQKRDGS